MSPIDEAASVDAFKDVPVIDLAHIFSDDPSFRKGLVSQIRDACIRVGFFYVSNHGIPEEVIADALAGAKQFFALPLETKMEIENKKQPNFKGYCPLLSGNNDPYGAGDLQEGFQFGWEALDNKGVQDESISGAMTGANVWPSEATVTGFRNAALTYYHAATKLGKALFPLFAEALDQRPDFFHDKVRRFSSQSESLLKLVLSADTAFSGFDEAPLLSPPVRASRWQGYWDRCSYGCFTILWQEPGIQALQVLNSEKQWINAPPMSGTLVIK
ncbi:hypothetical protein D9611_011057 [Ephemerocybe angulata]|uniref:Non-haem dioxygenase N-terminal domain-containing protein n=1 Tax=Ephemerocybe angulata TaxID=980116 RepID=A0A8H5BCH6_9AGAR|nr:hypothetical protein D9611_011057 [Tulosesus angulatus]